MTKVMLTPSFEESDEEPDEVIFRQYPKGKFVKGEIVIPKAPKKKAGRPSKAQQEHRQRFKEAVADAKAAMQDPELRMYYEVKAGKNKISMFGIAVSAYMKLHKKPGSENILSSHN